MRIMLQDGDQELRQSWMLLWTSFRLLFLQTRVRMLRWVTQSIFLQSCGFLWDSNIQLGVVLVRMPQSSMARLLVRTRVIPNSTQQQMAFWRVLACRPMSPFMQLSTSTSMKMVQILWLEAQLIYLFTSWLKKRVGRSAESCLWLETMRNPHAAKATSMKQILGLGTSRKMERRRSGTKVSLREAKKLLQKADLFKSVNSLCKQGLSASPSSFSFGLSPRRASTSTLSQHLLSTAKSIGVFPFWSGSFMFAPNSANLASTSGRLLKAAQGMSSFLLTSTLPDQLAMLAPWMAQWSTFPPSTAPFARSRSTYSLRQYMPAMSRGAWPMLVGRLRMGSPCASVERYSGMKGELCEHMWAKADVPEESTQDLSLSFSRMKAANLPYTFSSSRQTCLSLFSKPCCGGAATTPLLSPESRTRV